MVRAAVRVPRQKRDSGPVDQPTEQQEDKQQGNWGGQGEEQSAVVVALLPRQGPAGEQKAQRQQEAQNEYVEAESGVKKIGHSLFIVCIAADAGGLYMAARPVECSEEVGQKEADGLAQLLRLP